MSETHPWVEDNHRLLKPTTQVAIVEKTLFPDHPEFYARFQLLNIEKHYPYTDMFALNVLSLKQTDIATEEDKTSGRTLWAEVFNARTWEELHAATSSDPDLQEVATMIFKANADIKQRSLLEARNKYREIQNTYIGVISDLREQLAQSLEQLTQTREQNADMSARLTETQSSLLNAEGRIAALEAMVAELKRGR